MADRDYPIVVDAAGNGDAGFVAYAPDLPGCMADGETREQAIDDLQHAIEEWIDEAHVAGLEVPAPGGVKERFHKERAEIESLIAAQGKLIETQEKLLAQQRSEISLARRRLSLLAEADDQPGHGYWLKAAHVTAVVAKKRTRSLTN